ncbi:MAG: nitroreductase family deazaflavin-dependent oxidoreductase [bacterium]|nr:nitroreductase family deazaflavin-dependent oxidoreductase [bacterium]
MQKSIIAAALLLLTCGSGAIEGEAEPNPKNWIFSRAERRVTLELRPANPYTVRVRFADQGPHLYFEVESANDEAWVADLRAEPGVRIAIGKRVFAVRAQEIDDPDERLRAYSRLWWKRHDADPPPNLRPEDDTAYFRLDPR